MYPFQDYSTVSTRSTKDGYEEAFSTTSNVSLTSCSTSDNPMMTSTHDVAMGATSAIISTDSSADSVVHDVKEVLKAKLDKCEDELFKAGLIRGQISDLEEKIEKLKHSVDFRTDGEMAKLEMDKVSLKGKLDRVALVVGVLEKHN